MFGLWGMEQFVINKSLFLAWAIYAIDSGRALSHVFTPGIVTEHTPQVYWLTLSH